MSKTRIRLTRAELYEKVWATPMRTLSQEFGMSDVGLAKVCRKHKFPVPPVGYWRRKETGYKVTQPRLPAAKDRREHLDICVRERLPPEFEDLARQTAPKIAIAPGVSTRGETMKRSLGLHTRKSRKAGQRKRASSPHPYYVEGRHQSDRKDSHCHRKRVFGKRQKDSELFGANLHPRHIG
jgi:hypothetical protein